MRGRLLNGLTSCVKVVETCLSKTHPNSKYLLADRPLNPDPELKRSIFVFDKVTFKLVKTLKIPSKYKNVRAVHEEFNEDGSEFWISVWGKRTIQRLYSFMMQKH